MPDAKRTLDRSSLTDSPNRGIRCFRCGCGSVCLQWHQNLLLHFNYADLVRATECLEGVLSEPPFGFSLGTDSFCACHGGDGWYYLLCRDRVVLRLSEEEARSLRDELTAGRTALEHDSRTPLRVM